MSIFTVHGQKSWLEKRYSQISNKRVGEGVMIKKQRFENKQTIPELGKKMFAFDPGAPTELTPRND